MFSLLSTRERPAVGHCRLGSRPYGAPGGEGHGLEAHEPMVQVRAHGPTAHGLGFSLVTTALHGAALDDSRATPTARATGSKAHELMATGNGGETVIREYAQAKIVVRL